jgi:hypothetical protein
MNESTDSSLTSLERFLRKGSNAADKKVDGEMAELVRETESGWS